MQLRSWVGLVLITILAVPGRGLAAADVAPFVTARAAIVVDGATGDVLWSRSPDLELPPASTTKVMTAILALESDALERRFPVSAEACRVVPRKVNLRAGQRLKLEDLVYAILLNSANDASVVIAESLAGSVEAFGDRMTARARQLGALHTRFMNPHGLTEDGHYTTARDLVTIFDHALDVPRFREVISTKSITIPIENSRQRIALRSHNRLLESYRIPVIGKTGYTIPAKKCFVGAGTHEGREVLVAVLGSTDLWGDVRRLLEFGYGDEMPPAAPALRRARMRPAPARKGGRRQFATGKSRGAVRVARSPGAAKYAVRIGSFDRMDNARQVQRALGRRGFDVAISQVSNGSGKKKRTRYVVHVGPYANRGAAESAVRTVQAQVKMPAQIIQR